jgi:hypothetical protein
MTRLVLDIADDGSLYEASRGGCLVPDVLRLVDGIDEVVVEGPKQLRKAHELGFELDARWVSVLDILALGSAMGHHPRCFGFTEALRVLGLGELPASPDAGARARMVAKAADAMVRLPAAGSARAFIERECSVMYATNQTRAVADPAKVHAIGLAAAARRDEARALLSKLVWDLKAQTPYHPTVSRAVELASGVPAPLIDGARRWTDEAVRRNVGVHPAIAAWHEWRSAHRTAEVAAAWRHTAPAGDLSWTVTTPDASEAGILYSKPGVDRELVSTLRDYVGYLWPSTLRDLPPVEAWGVIKPFLLENCVGSAPPLVTTEWVVLPSNCPEVKLNGSRQSLARL